MISTKSQPWLCPPKLTPILGSWIRSLLSSKCSSAHIHLCLDLRSLHAVVLPSPASRQQGHHRHCQSPSSAAVPTRAQTTRARAQFAPRLTHNERTLASRFRGRAICFLLKPQPRNCAARSLKAMASVRRTAQLPVTARRAGAVCAHSVTRRRCPPGMLGAESLSE